MRALQASFAAAGVRPLVKPIPRNACSRRPRRTFASATTPPPASSPASAPTPTTKNEPNASNASKSAPRAVISSLEGVSYTVGGATVVADVSLDVYDGEIVCILGPSGSGKSTLLRMLAGLTAPSTGRVLYRGKPFNGPNPGASIVFQTFALYPWLTVLENVELGAGGGSRAARAQSRERAMRTIDIIGLDGYENAYPRELSGGMRQRVGFARALAVQPELLCMDEPFSALDVLTAENLRSELLRLWMAGDVPTTSVLIVTHGIEEAVGLADRIVILGGDPGHVRAVLNVEMPHPRNRKSPIFQEWADLVYTILAERHDDASVEDIIASGPVAAAAAAAPAPAQAEEEVTKLAFDGASASRPLTPVSDALGAETTLEPARYPQLPGVRIGSVAGLLAFIAGEPVDLYRLGQRLQLDVDDLYPIIDAADILRLIEVDDGDVCINAKGLLFMQAGIDERKALVKEAMLTANGARLVQQIHRMLVQAGDGAKLPQELIFDAVLLKHFSPQESRRQLEIAIEWGRFAELFGYEALTGTLFLDQGDVAEEDDEGGDSYLP